MIETPFAQGGYLPQAPPRYTASASDYQTLTGSTRMTVTITIPRKMQIVAISSRAIWTDDSIATGVTNIIDGRTAYNGQVLTTAEINKDDISLGSNRNYYIGELSAPLFVDGGDTITLSAGPKDASFALPGGENVKITVVLSVIGLPIYP